MTTINVMTKQLRHALCNRRWRANPANRLAENQRQKVRNRQRVRTNWLKHTPEYVAYHHAMARCTKPNHKDWDYYGGRGIEFRFTSFNQFFAELGPRPDGKTLDRINNNGHYEPGNVRWATRSEQNLNRRNTTNHQPVDFLAAIEHNKQRCTDYRKRRKQHWVETQAA